MRVASSAGSAHERLTEVVAAALEVAAEAGETGVYTDETARVLTAVVGKIGARISVEAEVHGFAGGWQEAVAHLGRTHPDPGDAQVLPMRPDGDDGP
ncbi:hypothetical protein GCM10010249_06990 [Streptomyces roseolilacinus]|uniref:Uncharacterized protein n=1 Tax=Streptomyces roseolilacinus TaxID=66904 RepID=A0A918EJP7_9ACTN|nr:hypothetical protein GCM10010249_06990 [Streptomyces roseolilacinus]